jgi:dihydroneopterin aldolase
MEYQINLEGLRFYCFHGVYEEEKIVGGWFRVDANVSVHVKKTIEELEDVVNYVSIYDVIREEMNKPRPMLEQIASTMIDEVFELDKRIKKMKVTICKETPPIPQMQGSISIRMKKVR